MKICVTGGSGFIGSIVVNALIKQRHSVVVLDNLNYGHRTAVNQYARFVKADIRDRLDDIFETEKFDLVIHLAGYTRVEESIVNPKKYFNNNVVGGLNLLDTMIRHKVDKILFASSGTVYGQTKDSPCKESDISNPTNPYGDTKLMFENILKRYGIAYGLNHISFRFFIVVGASNGFGQDRKPETSLVPCALRAVLNNYPVSVYGMDYDTKDGTCVRDYVDVRDISKAFLLGIDKLNNSKLGQSGIYNLSTDGYSVLDVIDCVRKVTQKPLVIKKSDRRIGDPAILIADSSLAKSELGWKPEYTLEDSIRSAWDWMRKNPKGYRS